MTRREMLALMPFASFCAIEGGNAWARLGDVPKARRDWALAAKYLTPADPVQAQLAGVLKATEGGSLPAGWKPVRNPGIE